MDNLQSVHAQGIADGEYRIDRGADRGARFCSDASDLAGQARMACGGARGRWRAGAAYELTRGFRSKHERAALHRPFIVSAEGLLTGPQTEKTRCGKDRPGSQWQLAVGAYGARRDVSITTARALAGPR